METPSDLFANALRPECSPFISYLTGSEVRVKKVLHIITFGDPSVYLYFLGKLGYRCFGVSCHMKYHQ